VARVGDLDRDNSGERLNAHGRAMYDADCSRLRGRWCGFARSWGARPRDWPDAEYSPGSAALGAGCWVGLRL